MCKWTQILLFDKEFFDELAASEIPLKCLVPRPNGAFVLDRREKWLILVAVDLGDGKPAGSSRLKLPQDAPLLFRKDIGTV
jgi:hypothetical protein